MGRTPKQFVCADCNEIVLHPANQKGFLGCPQGHRVQGFPPRPALLEIGVTLFIALCASGLLIGFGNAVTGSATVAAMIVSGLFAAWAVS
jgi:hypothetical protein